MTECSYCRVWNRDAAFFCMRCGIALGSGAVREERPTQAVRARASERHLERERAISARAYVAGVVAIVLVEALICALGTDRPGMSALLLSLAALGIGTVVCLGVRLAEEQRQQRDNVSSVGRAVWHARAVLALRFAWRVVNPPRISRYD